MFDKPRTSVRGTLRTSKPQDSKNLDGRQESEVMKILEGCGFLSSSLTLKKLVIFNGEILLNTKFKRDKFK